MNHGHRDSETEKGTAVRSGGNTERVADSAEGGSSTETC